MALLSSPLRLGLAGAQMKGTVQPSRCPRQLSQALLPAVGGRGSVCGKGSGQGGGWGKESSPPPPTGPFPESLLENGTLAHTRPH